MGPLLEKYYIFKNMKRFEKEIIYTKGVYCFVVEDPKLLDKLKRGIIMGCDLCPFKASIICNCDVPGAQVLVDIKYYGKI